MKKKPLASILLWLLCIMFGVYAIQGWGNWLKVISNIVFAGIAGMLALGFNSMLQGRQHRQPRNDNADHRTIKWLQIISFTLFIVFLILYYLFHNNPLLGTSAFISLLYWLIILITNIIAKNSN
ncbi:MAG: hypothetical protein H9901_00550 [Candidatus Paralactobacillus gallistercoris]|uniref:DUF2178 domain-containing protein n=1 Tax=Candidatus Paralactobacillus gallistercoris TaxID=2838724 RepID=A0A948X0D2_9LACO|nr:hypothetical protein [Candidatus Paralactobacillus gallistercoris]